MIPSWLPQNIQKRIFKYILTKLAVFSNLDLDNLDVSLGTARPNLSLHDVILDTEKFNIPGLYVRDGNIKSLDLKLGFVDGILIEGSSINLTIALAASNQHDNLSDLLSRTTADLAASIIPEVKGSIHQELSGSVLDQLGDEEEEEEEVDDSGFGLGEFSDVISKVVDAAISQIRMSLKDVRITVIVDEQTTLILTIEELRMSTDDKGIRQTSIFNFEILHNEDQSSVPTDNIADNVEEEEEEEEDDSLDESQLMQSTLFSHEQASSMYMSAMSTMLQASRKEVSIPIVTCDSIEASFKGTVIVSNLNVRAGKCHINLDALPKLLRLVDTLSITYDSSQASSESSLHQPVNKNALLEQIQGQDNFLESIFIQEIIIGKDLNSPSALRLNLQNVEGRFESYSQLFKLGHVEVNRGTKLFWFSSEDLQESMITEADLIYRVVDDPENSSKTVTILISKPGYVKLTLEDVIEIVDLQRSLTELLKRHKKHHSNGNDDNERSASLVAQTNSFNVNIDTGRNKIRATVLPMSLESGIFSLGKMYLKINDVDVIDIGNSQLSFVSNSHVEIERSDSTKALAKVMSGVVVDNLLVKMSQETAESLREDVDRILHSISNDIDLSVPEASRKRVRIADEREEIVDLSILVKALDCQLKLSGKVGLVFVDVRDAEVNIFSSLGKQQISCGSVHVSRDFSDADPSVGHISLVHIVHPQSKDRPMVYLELVNGAIGEVKLYNSALEYHVRLLKLFEKVDKESTNETQQPVSEDNTSLGEQSNSHLSTNSENGENMYDSSSTIREDEVKFPIIVTDCVIGLSPLNMPSKAQLVIRDGHTDFKSNNNGMFIDVMVRKASMVLIDDLKYLESMGRERPTRHQRNLSNDQVEGFIREGYVSVGSLSSIKLNVSVIKMVNKPHVNITTSAELLFLESCADSAQTLIQVMNGLKPPIEGGDDIRYHVEVPGPINALEGIEESAFNEFKISSSSSRGRCDDDAEDGSDMSAVDFVADDLPSNLDFVESYYADRGSKSQWTNSSSGSLNAIGEYSKADLLLDQDLSQLAAKVPSGIIELNDSANRRFAVFEQRAQTHESMLDFSEDHFSRSHEEGSSPNSSSGAASHDSKDFLKAKQNLIKPPPAPPIKIEVNDTHVTWNLHDGYDWIHTQDTLTRAIKRVEVKANEVHREMLKRQEEGDSQEANNEDNEEEAEVNLIGDILFNSIYIGIPSGQDPGNLRKAINHDLNDDDASETTSVGTRSNNTSRSASGTRNNSSSGNGHMRDRLKLKRSKNHKVKIELFGLRGSISVYGERDSDTKQEEGAVLSSADLKIRDFEIIDNIPSSTWNKFLTYMRSAGEREFDKSMVHINMDTVKPMADIATSETILNVAILPLRLHVDQDTLDFLTRFFEFKDDRFSAEVQPEEITFIQKFDIRSIKVKLDYKPKKVDYAGLKSGHVTEFMNFFILDEADMVMKRIVLYGISGYPRLVQMLHDIWMPDIRSTQLGGVLAGIAPVRSLIRLGSGVRDLVVVPVREYRKDGRIVRSIQKGAWRFAKTTTNELVKFGAKIAAGTQTILETAEQSMGGAGAAGRTEINSTGSTRRRRYVSPYSDNLDDYDGDFLSVDEVQDGHSNAGEGPSKNVSLYANQPPTVTQGLQGAYISLGHNLTMARDAVVDIRAQASERGRAQDAAIAVVKAAPVALIRPMIGATEAVSKTLLGITNQIDPKQMQEVKDKYKQTGDQSDQY